MMDMDGHRLIVKVEKKISGDRKSMVRLKDASEEDMYADVSVKQSPKTVRILCGWLVVVCLISVAALTNYGRIYVAVAIGLLGILFGCTLCLNKMNSWVTLAFIALAGISMTFGNMMFDNLVIPPVLAYVVILRSFNASAGQQIGFPALPFLQEVIASGSISLFCIVVIATKMSKIDGTAVTLFLSVLLVWMGTAYGAFSSHRVHRQSFTRERVTRKLQADVTKNEQDKAELTQERHDLRTDVFVRAMESVGAPIIDMEKLNLDSPLEQAMGILKNMMDETALPAKIWKELQKANVLLAKSDILSPDLKAAIEDDRLQVDAETEAYLLDMISTGHWNNSHEKHKSKETSSTLDLEDDMTNLPGTILPPQMEEKGQVGLRSLMMGTEDWTFDVLEVTSLSNGRPLLFLGFALFNKYNLIEKFNIDQSKLRSFLTAIETGYRAMPYHNSVHAADVTRTVHFFLTQGNIKANCSDEEILACITGSIIHDFDHPGRTNNFLVATNNDLALLYNDKSVLEHHHSAQAHFLTKKDEHNIFENLNSNTKKIVRKIIIDLVLATDLSKHFQMVAQFKKMIAGNTLDMNTDEGRLMVLQMALKCGDLGHAAKPLVLHQIWTMKVNEEFYAQGDEEREAGIQISPFMDRNHPSIGKSQVGFLKFLVIPMYEEFMKFVDPEDRLPCMKHLRNNLEHWKKESALGQ